MMPSRRGGMTSTSTTWIRRLTAGTLTPEKQCEQGHEDVSQIGMDAAGLKPVHPEERPLDDPGRRQQQPVEHHVGDMALESVRRWEGAAKRRSVHLGTQRKGEQADNNLGERRGRV